jgi:predicted DNA-binding protein (UPF0251 family)
MLTIDDICLEGDPALIRRLFKHYYYLESLRERSTGASNLMIEIAERFYGSGLTRDHRNAIRANLIHDRTQKESGEILGLGTRMVARLVTEGLDMMAQASFDAKGAATDRLDVLEVIPYVQQ